MRQIPFSMKTLAVAALALLMTGCANDDAAQENTSKQSDTKGMTEFAIVDNDVNAKAAPATRSAGEYTGSGIKFYWTSGDQLWINNTAVTPSLKASNRSTIPASNGKELTAKFYFDGVYTASTYPVRYTGNGNTVGDKVTIAAAQSQQTPNDGAHIGTDGDCGTAVATRQTDGSYQFTLDHKASYITFAPYYSYGFADDVKVTQIKVTADEALAGEFGFNDNGLDLTTRPFANSSNRSITLKLNGGGTDGFPIPSASDYTKNAAIMVLAPGTYHNFTVEYTLHDSKTNVTGAVTQSYGTKTFSEGKNKRVAANLAVPHYQSDIYYMWDAAVGQHAWKGHENNQPILNDGVDSHYPASSSDARWYNSVGFPTSASRSAKDCPNANELLWYALKGDPHWDPSIWSIMTHLYSGGMWLKKRATIARDQGKTLQQLKDAAPGGTNYTINYPSAPKIYETYATIYNRNIKVGKPTNSSDYIFLPVYGYYHSAAGELGMLGRRGYYWSSTPRPDQNLNAYNLYVERNAVHTGYGDRNNAHCLWPE